MVPFSTFFVFERPRSPFDCSTRTSSGVSWNVSKAHTPSESGSRNPCATKGVRLSCSSRSCLRFLIQFGRRRRARSRRRSVRLLRAARSMVARPLFRRHPVNQARGNLLPIPGPLRADKAHHVALHLVLASDLVASVLKDQSFIGRLPPGKGAGKQKYDRELSKVSHIPLLRRVPHAECCGSIPL